MGYPDLAAGAAYKALLLADAIADESDEFHDAAVGDLLDAEHQHSSLQTHDEDVSEDSNQEKLISLILEEKRLQM